MKIILFFLFLLVKFNGRSQQSKIIGQVSMFNSQTKTGIRKFIFNAQVEDDFKKAQPTLTDNNGHFTLFFIGVKEKSAVSFQVKKIGLQVVNLDALSAVAGQNNVIKISMAHPDSIAEYRRVIYDIGKTQAERNLNILVKQKNRELSILKNNIQQNINKIRHLEKELSDLEVYRLKINEEAQELARKYAPINLDDASPLFRIAFMSFQNGNLDSAQLILKLADFPIKVQNLLLEEKKIEYVKKLLGARDSVKNQRKREYAEGIQLKGDLHRTQYEFDSALVCHELLIMLDSLNTSYLLNYASFIQWLNQYDKAIFYFSKLLKIYEGGYIINPKINWQALAKIQISLGQLYSNKNRFSDAEAFYLKGLSLCQTFNQTNDKNNTAFIAGIKNDLGNLYRSTHEYAKAEVFFIDALKIFESLVTLGQRGLEPELANTYNNLGVLYSAGKDFDKAASAYSQSLKITMTLDQTNPEIYDVPLSNTQNNLGNVYFQKNDFTNAEVFCNAALKIRLKLARISPQSYEPYVATTQNNLGNIYFKRRDYPMAERFYSEALEIRIRLGETNPETYEPLIARTLNNLGNVYDQEREYSKALGAYQRVLVIYKRLFNDYPQIYEANVALTQNNLGIVYFHQNDTAKAKTAYSESLNIYYRLATIDPGIYYPNLAMVLYNLGHLFFSTNNYVEAKESYAKSLEIKKYLVTIDSNSYEPDVAETKNKLGLVLLRMENYVESERLLIESLLSSERRMHNYPDYYTKNVNETVKNILDLYVTILNKYKVDSLKNLNPDNFWPLKKIIVNQSKSDPQIAEMLWNYYSNRSWDLIFALKFNESETVARNGLILDSTNIWLKIRLAHSLLLQEKYQAAFLIYQELKLLKEGIFFTNICHEELNELLSNGITNQYVEQIKQFLKN